MRLFIYILVLLLPAGTWAQTKLTASVSHNPVATGQRFQLKFELNANGSGFSSPNMENFQVLSGPNQSSSMSWVNGNMSSSITFSYVLVPIKEGTFTIGSASIKTGGKTYKSNPIKVTVVKGKTQAKQKAQQAGNQSTAGKQKATSNQIGDNIILKSQVSKNSVYQGEHLVATYKLYYRLNIVNNDFSTLPSFNGFWTQDIDVPQNTNKTEILNGVRYNVAELKKTLLFPQRSGELEVDPMGMKLTVRIQDNRRARSIFDQVFGSFKDVAYNPTSKSMKVKVKPLPKAGKPANFNGAVGNFKLKATVNKSKLKANEAINLKVTLKGSGNLKLLDKLDLNFPPDFEVYDPKVKDNINVKATGVSGKRTFEYLIIPRHSGNFEIPSIKFSYFNPGSKKYVKLNTDPIPIEVEKGDEEETQTITSISKEDVKFIGKDIRFIKSGPPELQEQNDFFFGTPLYYTLFSSPLLAFFLFLGIRKGRDQYNSDITRVKSRRANKIATKRLSTAKKLMNDSTKFYEEIFKAMYGYLGDKLNIEVAQLSKENIASNLAQRDVDQALIIELTETLDLCEMARFAPINNTTPQKVYDQSAELIGKLEGKIR